MIYNPNQCVKTQEKEIRAIVGEKSADHGQCSFRYFPNYLQTVI